VIKVKIRVDINEIEIVKGNAKIKLNWEELECVSHALNIMRIAIKDKAKLKNEYVEMKI